MQANGVTAVMSATVNLQADLQIMVPANCLLRLCAMSVLEEECNSFEERPQKKRQLHEMFVNKGNMQTQEQLVAEELVFLDFSSSIDHNSNNEAFGNNRLQSKVRHCEHSYDQKSNMVPAEQLLSEKMTADDLNCGKHSYCNIAGNPTKHMKSESEVQACDSVGANSDSPYLL